jgi:signal transduction histidine kinase
MQGWGWQKVHHPDHVGRVVEKIQKSWDTGDVWEDTFPLRSKTGEYRWFLSRAVPIKNQHGQIVRWFGTNTDVENLRRIDAELREANQQLQTLSEKQKQFVADAAHELRAPLTAIQGNLQLLDRYKLEENLKEEMLGDVRRESERLGRLVNDLLAIARGDNGLTLKKAELALEQVLLASWRNATVLSSQHRFELGDLPRVGIVGNADRLQQLTLILLENAVKYTPQGGSISLGLEKHKRAVRFYVRDTGIGISGEDLPRVFERFFRADKARTRSHDSAGTGLGLSIAEWIVGQHGGKIWLESELQEGTTVWVELPLP